ncbi:nicotinate-nucleotide adenylyltransferase [Legionella shakespearei]|uniref:Probable nicotinate-nucleotide adenylyltransferase n=1 Tax=Legionella shakespearei DSM 23087 TaxID=1122169 RepID=A0A0W0YRE0_9GAMM|nr:nicotinate-nucleotide adenylyltransferase [Legionella shakespearei]KTD59214.1 nicotinate-nucleotide adenylyltransferase NadD [Legionella shakespearei DSM 23087]
MRRLAFFGGTFNPVHNGHIETCKAIQSCFNFDELSFIPCKSPVLKEEPVVTPEQRVAMLELAIKGNPSFSIDLREIERDTPSYMSETLESLRAEHQEDSLTLIMGYDAFLSLPYWHNWKKILTLANLLVINRDEYAESPVPVAVKELLERCQVTDKERLLRSKANAIYFFDAGNYEISSTRIRNELQQGTLTDGNIPHEVYEYIKAQRLYQ